MKVKNEDVIGWHVGEESVCPECVTDEETDNASANDVITRDDLDKAQGEEMLWCDRCKEHRIY